MKPRLILWLCLIAPSAWPQSQPLGRLFFTPQQRAILDQQRQNGSVQPDQVSSYTLNGEVQRSSGQNTRWVNGQAQRGPMPSGASGTNGTSGKIGETYQPGSGERKDLLNGGKIIIQRAVPTP